MAENKLALAEQDLQRYEGAASLSSESAQAEVAELREQLRLRSAQLMALADKNRMFEEHSVRSSGGSMCDPPTVQKRVPRGSSVLHADSTPASRSVSPPASSTSPQRRSASLTPPSMSFLPTTTILPSSTTAHRSASLLPSVIIHGQPMPLPRETSRSPPAQENVQLESTDVAAEDALLHPPPPPPSSPDQNSFVFPGART
eukprot:NODE_2419_length_1122_cov_7.660764_g2010_i0.p1 GENE.NODE_2419_length_1122_cov_7.660764_g2010_i0~~NODE_2419_length_1122_cov_7.660764_g2010_i0.p1  ORF type:complete len:201 (+),score=23.37 NODE_2419_length_1122_cov_7.660764_g2010_i0:451-1053(+)